MTAVPKQKLTEAEYLAIERAAEFKSEFYDGVMYPLHGPPGPTGMAGARYEHNAVKENLAVALANALRGGPCRTLSSDMKVKVPPTGPYLYPDVLVVCGSPMFPTPESTDVLLNPAVVIEVLSPTTQGYDRGLKFRQYQKISSLMEFVLVAADEMVCERFLRQSVGTWVLTTFDDPKGEFALATMPVGIPMVDIYAGVQLPERPAR